MLSTLILTLLATQLVEARRHGVAAENRAQKMRAPAQRRRQVLDRKAGAPTYELKGKETSLKDLEPVFRRLLAGKPFKLVIPPDRLGRMKIEEARDIKYAAQQTDYYPYRLEAARSLDAKYSFEKLLGLKRAIVDLQRASQRQEPAKKHWKPNHKGRHFFSISPTSAMSERLYQRSDRLEDVVDRVHRLGNPAFGYMQKDRTFVITDTHYLAHLKETGTSTITMFRGHSGFDVFFYNLYLGSKKRRPALRKKFASWLDAEFLNTAAERNVPHKWLRKIIDRLRDRTESLDDILYEISQHATTSALFTSLSDERSGYWMNQRRKSEIVKLKVDLKRIPESYLKQIMYGRDLDIEVVFPYGTRKQFDALKECVKLQSRP